MIKRMKEILIQQKNAFVTMESYEYSWKIRNSRKAFAKVLLFLITSFSFKIINKYW